MHLYCMRRTTLVFLLTRLLFSCTEKGNDRYYDPDVQKIITTCLMKTWGTADSARYYYQLLPEIDGPISKAVTAKYNDSIKKILDTTDVYIVIKDTLGLIGAGDREDIEAFVKKYIADPEKTYLSIKPTYLSPLPQQLNLSVLESNAHIPIFQKEKINPNAVLHGTYLFSNVIFNKQKTIAAVCLNYFMQPRKTGYGEIFLLSKIKDEWVIIKRERTWVS